MGDAKQVASDANAGGREESSILGDIIEQQREFQRCQELRAGNLAAIRQAMANLSIDSQEEEQVVNKLTEINKGHGTRRKFSLSYAMSNLTSFTSGASGAGVSGSPAKPSKKNLQHRASLVHGQANSAFGLGLGGFSPASNQKERDKDSEKSASEKKKGFMHKAIRRGSKMFDSMLLSSAQQQAAAAAAAGNVDADISGFSTKPAYSSSQEVEGFEKELSRVQFRSSTSSSIGAGIGPGLGSGAKAAAAAAAKAEEAEPICELEHKKRGRRLRLGSIPHDLRRALSLSNNAHFHRKSSKQHDAEVAGNISESLASQLGLNPTTTMLASNTNASNATPSSTTNLATESNNSSTNSNSNSNININNSNSNSTNNSFTSRAAQHLNLSSSKGGSSSNQSASAVGFNRLKRKNSLFSPLTSAGSAFYHHAHFGRHSGAEPVAESHHNLGQAVQQQGKAAAGIGPTMSLGAKSGMGSTQASSNSSQSASFTLCQDHNRTYKLIIFGSSAVGKTSLIQRFLYGLFPGKL